MTANPYPGDKPGTLWTTSHPSLTDGKAAHETAGILRMHRNGWPMTEISKATGVINGPPLARLFEKAISDEGDAAREGRKIVGAQGGPTSFTRAKAIVVGDELVDHGDAVVNIRRLYGDIVFVLEGGKEVTHRSLDEILVRSADGRG